MGVEKTRATIARSSRKYSTALAHTWKCGGVVPIPLVLGLWLGAIPARGEEPSDLAGPPPTEQASPESSDENLVVEPVPQDTGSRLEPPPGVEIMRIKGGKGLAGLEAEVPASVTQFDPEDIAALGAQDVSDLARVTPNLEINTISSTTATFFIRGVGLNDFNSNAAGAVAVYWDGVPLNAPALQLGQLFDIENVEILRGPQGYGDDRNASGGAIKTYTRKPDGQIDASLRADYGNYNFVDVESALGFPIVDESLSGRVAFRLRHRDPFYQNRCGNVIDTPNSSNKVCNEAAFPTFPPIPPGLPEEVNDIDNWAGRGQLRFQLPDRDMDWLLNVHGAQFDYDSPLGQVIGTDSIRGLLFTSTNYIDPAVDALFRQNRQAILPTLPPGPRRGAEATRLAKELTLAQVVRDIDLAQPYANDYDLVGKEQHDSIGGFVRGDLSFGPIRASTITGTEYYDRSRLTDFDFSSNPAIAISRNDDAWQFSQNLNFNWEHPESSADFDWGGYYLMEYLNADANFKLRNPTPSDTFQSYQQDLYSFGIYGSFSWEFHPDLTLEGGVRFNWEQKHFDLLVQRIGTVRSEPVSDQKTWSAPTGGISLTYRAADDVATYLKYTRGWKAGHFNASVLEREVRGEIVSTAVPTVAEPETIDAFETGLRSTWFEGRLGLGAALFYYLYSNYQVFVLENQFGSPPQLEVINANDARVWGAEVDFRVEPLAGWAPVALDGLVLSGRFGWLGSEFLDFSDIRTTAITTDSGEVSLATVTADFTGNRLPNAPRFKVSGSVEYPIDLGHWGMLIPRYDFSWTDDIYFDPTEGRGVNRFFGTTQLPEYSVGQRAYWVHDARLAYRFPTQNIEIAGWVRNFTDTVYKTYVADVTVGFGSLLNFIGEPRTYGISLQLYY